MDDYDTFSTTQARERAKRASDPRRGPNVSRKCHFFLLSSIFLALKSGWGGGSRPRESISSWDEIKQLIKYLLLRGKIDYLKCTFLMLKINAKFFVRRKVSIPDTVCDLLLILKTSFFSQISKPNEKWGNSLCSLTRSNIPLTKSSRNFF